jgi:hypothetical protein
MLDVMLMEKWNEDGYYEVVRLSSGSVVRVKNKPDFKLIAQAIKMVEDSRIINGEVQKDRE